MTTIPSWFVIVMGISTVFIGLICIIILCKILGVVCSLIDGGKSKTSQSTPYPIATEQTYTGSAFPNRQEVIAVIGAVIAEKYGVDVDAIRIKSIKRI